LSVTRPLTNLALPAPAPTQAVPLPWPLQVFPLVVPVMLVGVPKPAGIAIWIAVACAPPLAVVLVSVTV